MLNISFKPCDYDIICSEDIYTDSDLPDCDVYISDFFPSYETRYYIIRRSIKPNSTNAMKNIIPSKTKDGDSSVALPFDSYFNVYKQFFPLESNHMRNRFMKITKRIVTISAIAKVSACKTSSDSSISTTSMLVSLIRAEPTS